MAELKELMQLKNETDESVDLYLYGDIVSGWWGKWEDEDTYPAEIRDFLQSAGGRDINVHINSGGGSVFAGMAIYNLLAHYSGTVTAYVDGMAASIASVIALAADRTVMRTGSVMMIHKPALVMMGVYNADELMKLASDIDAVQRCIMQVYEKHGKIDTSEIEEKVNAETWLPAEEAADVFDIDVETEEAVAAVGSEFIAKVAANIPPQYAQGTHPPSDEDKNKAEIEILELEEKK